MLQVLSCLEPVIRTENRQKPLENKRNFKFQQTKAITHEKRSSAQREL